MQIKDTKYIIYAQGTMSQDGRMRALYWRKSGSPRWLYGADADKFDEKDANRISQYSGQYKWVKYPVKDSAINDIRPGGYDAKTQEDKLTSYSLEFRKRMNANPKKKAEILLEAKAAYDNVVEDTDNSVKQDIKLSAEKHWKDLQGFADKLNDVNVVDMALDRADAIDRCISLGKQFIQHFDKIYKEPKNSAVSHWMSEMRNWFGNVKAIKLKSTHEPLLNSQLHDWFLTAGAEARDFMNNPTPAEIKAYDDFALKVLSSGVDSAFKGIKLGDNMPKVNDKLIQSSSKEALSKNIATEIKAGKDPKQAAAIAYSIQKENDSNMKDGLNVIVKLNGKTYKGAFSGVSGADKRFGDVYIPELVSLHSGDKGVFNPDEGNYVSDGKFYFKMENLKKWNPFLKDYIKEKDNTIKDGLGLANLRALINTGEVDTSRVNTTGEVIIRFKNDADKKDAMRKLYQHRVPIDSEKGLALYIDAERILSTINDSMIEDTDMFNITFERNGVFQSNLVRANSEEDAKQKFILYAKKHNLPEAKIISVGPNREGYKPGKPVIDGESIKDAPPVDVLGIVQSKRDNTGKTWYLLSISTKSGNKGYLVTGEYDGGFHHSGGGAVSFNLNTAKADMDAFITIANLKSKYGEAEGYKRYMAGQKDSTPVKVIAKKAMETRDGCSRHYLEVEDCDGKRFYMVTDEYDGCSKQFSGGGSVIEDKALLNKKYKDDLASGLTSVGRSAISGAKEVKSKIEQASRDDAVDLEMYKKPLDNLMQCGQVKDGVSASKVDAMLGINDLNTTKQLLRDAGIKYSAVTSKVSQYKIVEGKCVKVEE